MKTEAKTKLRELKTGVHLVVITDAIIIKDGDKPKVSESGEMGITVRFTDGKNFSFDQDYWINGERHHFFTKMCAAANINVDNPKFKAEAKGKRLWICIKEVHDIDGDKPVLMALTDEPVINYFLFDTIPCLDPLKKPTVVGDPESNEGIASEQFLDYRQINSGQIKEIIITNSGSGYTSKPAPTGNVLVDEALGLTNKVDPFADEKQNEILHDNSQTVTNQDHNQEIDWDEF